MVSFTILISYAFAGVCVCVISLILHIYICVCVWWLDARDSQGRGCQFAPSLNIRRERDSGSHHRQRSGQSISFIVCETVNFPCSLVSLVKPICFIKVSFEDGNRAKYRRLDVLNQEGIESMVETFYNVVSRVIQSFGWIVFALEFGERVCVCGGGRGKQETQDICRGESCCKRLIRLMKIICICRRQSGLGVLNSSRIKASITRHSFTQSRLGLLFPDTKGPSLSIFAG